MHLGYGPPRSRLPSLLIAGIALLSFSALAISVLPRVAILLPRALFAPLMTVCMLGWMPAGLLGVIFASIGFYQATRRR
jgi:hypothetical protein